MVRFSDVMMSMREPRRIKPKNLLCSNAYVLPDLGNEGHPVMFPFNVSMSCARAFLNVSLSMPSPRFGLSVESASVPEESMPLLGSMHEEKLDTAKARKKR
jgi:hypothetical protein